MTRLAFLISKMEGFGIPGVIPTVRNNPGDLKHSPHSSHAGIDPNSIGIIDTVADGWADLERQLQLFAERGLTLRQMVFDVYAPPSENDSQNYLNFLCSGLGLPEDAPVAEALEQVMPDDYQNGSDSLRNTGGGSSQA